MNNIIDKYLEYTHREFPGAGQRGNFAFAYKNSSVLHICTKFESNDRALHTVGKRKLLLLCLVIEALQINKELI
jgi:hypothetical protein